MKRVRCPKCDNYIPFDDTRYEPGQSLVFQCPQCGRQFAFRIKKPLPSQPIADDSKVVATTSDAVDEQLGYGQIVVIENCFHYKQVLLLSMGNNTIGRYQKGNPITTPIETVDPSVDLLHCVIHVGRDKKGRLRYTLSDANSNTGTFVDNTELKSKEKRIITDGTLFTIGATSILLKL